MSEHPPGYTPLPVSLRQDLLLSKLAPLLHSCPTCRGSKVVPHNYKYVCAKHKQEPNYFSGNYEGFFLP